MADDDLKESVSADLMESPGQYLHGTEDFDSWVSEFDGGE